MSSASRTSPPHGRGVRTIGSRGCHSEWVGLEREASECRQRWAAEKPTLLRDHEFLHRWLVVLARFTPAAAEPRASRRAARSRFRVGDRRPSPHQSHGARLHLRYHAVLVPSGSGRVAAGSGRVVRVRAVLPPALALRLGAVHLRSQTVRAAVGTMGYLRMAN